ncbi:MAG: hypothetical protein GY765_31875 [bacterium]|nr:hypothetical protein [bacterium]
MKKISLIIVLLMAALVCFGHPAKVADLDEITRPNTIYYPVATDGDYFYVADGVEIFVYSLKDYKLVKKFGKAGEGPKEFKGYDGNTGVLLNVTADGLVVESQNKLSYFTRDGNFKKEVRSTSGYLLAPCGDKFVGFSNVMEGEKPMRGSFLYSSDFKKVKELMRIDYFMRAAKFNPYTFRLPRGIYADGKIFIASHDGIVKAFDLEGKELCKTTYEYEKVKVDDVHKKETMEIFRSDPRVRNNFEQLKSRVKFPAHFPAMKQHNVDSGKIYVLTHYRKGDNSRFVVYDTNCKFLERKMITVLHNSELEPAPYTIFKGKLYQLAENEEDESLELHITEIK